MEMVKKIIKPYSYDSVKFNKKIFVKKHNRHYHVKLTDNYHFFDLDKKEENIKWLKDPEMEVEIRKAIEKYKLDREELNKNEGNEKEIEKIINKYKVFRHQKTEPKIYAELRVKHPYERQIEYAKLSKEERYNDTWGYPSNSGEFAYTLLLNNETITKKEFKEIEIRRKEVESGYMWGVDGEYDELSEWAKGQLKLAKEGIPLLKRYLAAYDRTEREKSVDWKKTSYAIAKETHSLKSIE